jgi:hypothetical protein
MIQNGTPENKLRPILDSNFNEENEKVSNLIAKIKTLERALKELKKTSEHLSQVRMEEISHEIKKGLYVFKPLNSYKIPKKSVLLNKSGVKKFTKNFSVEEKDEFFKKMKKSKRHTQEIIEYRYIFEETFENKVIAKAMQIVLEDIIERKKYFPLNMFAYLNNTSSIDVIDYLKNKVGQSHLTFMIKGDLKDFFSSIKKRHIIKGLAELVNLKDNKFYHLVKSYLRRGYCLKILSKSKRIGARRVKIVCKNKSKDYVYQGSVLAPLFSNIVNALIIREINELIHKKYTLGQKRTINKRVRRLVNIKYRGSITKTKHMHVIKGKKFTCFTNDYQRA